MMRFRKTALIPVLAIALVAVPTSGALGSKGERDSAGEHQAKRSLQREVRKAAKRRCKAELREIGREAFRERYGDRRGGHAKRKCMRLLLGDARADARNAAQECGAERTELGREAFEDRYGGNRKHRNAFGKCVSSRVKALDDERPDDDDCVDLSDPDEPVSNISSRRDSGEDDCEQEDVDELELEDEDSGELEDEELEDEDEEGEVEELDGGGNEGPGSD